MMYNPSLDRTDDTAHGHCMALAAATRASISVCITEHMSTRCYPFRSLVSRLCCGSAYAVTELNWVWCTVSIRTPLSKFGYRARSPKLAKRKATKQLFAPQAPTSAKWPSDSHRHAGAQRRRSQLRRAGPARSRVRCASRIAVLSP